MTSATPKILDFEEFLFWKPDNKQYELYEGIAIEMQPTGKYEEIVGFLNTELAVEYKSSKLPYFIPKTALVKRK